MAKTYCSKIDAWLLTVLLSSVVVALVASATVMLKAPAIWPLALIIDGLAVCLPLWILLSTRYTLEEGILYIRCGPFKWQVRVVEITDVTPTSNMLSSPALSLDRLLIQYGRGRRIMVSPRDKTQFLNDLQAMRG